MADFDQESDESFEDAHDDVHVSPGKVTGISMIHAPPSSTPANNKVFTIPEQVNLRKQVYFCLKLNPF